MSPPSLTIRKQWQPFAQRSTAAVASTRTGALTSDCSAFGSERWRKLSGRPWTVRRARHRRSGSPLWTLRPSPRRLPTIWALRAEDKTDLLNAIAYNASACRVGDLITSPPVLAGKAERRRRRVVHQAMRIAPGDCAGLTTVNVVSFDVVPTRAGVILTPALPPIVGSRWRWRWRYEHRQGQADEQGNSFHELPHSSAPPITSLSSPMTSCTSRTAVVASGASSTAVRWSLIVQSLPGASRNRAITGPIVGMCAPFRACPVSTGESLVTVTLKRGTTGTVPINSAQEPPRRPKAAARAYSRDQRWR